MDGLWKRLLAGSLLCGAVGCSHFRDNNPKPLPTTEPPLAMTDRPIIEDRRAKNEGPIKVETLVTLGNVRVQAAADENRSNAEREDLAKQARTVFQQALSREPKNLEATLGMARMYAVVREKDKCMEWYQRAAQTNPNKGEIWFEMGKCMGSTFKDRDTAIACLHTATRVSPEDRRYRTELGFTLALAGRYEESRAWLSRTMPEAQARYNLAGMMKHNGHTEMAKRELALALHADPNHEPSRDMLADLSGAREMQPDNPVHNASYEQSPMSPVGPSPKIPIDPMIPRRNPGSPTIIQTPEPLPLNINRQNSVMPPLMPTGGWDR